MKRIAKLLSRAFVYTHLERTENAARNLDAKNEYVGTLVAGRNSFNSWRQGMEEEDLRGVIEEFVSSHADDEAQEDRWRTRMMRRLGAMLVEQDERIMNCVEERLESVLSKQTPEHERVSQQLQRLEGMLGGVGMPQRVRVHVPEAAGAARAH